MIDVTLQAVKASILESQKIMQSMHRAGERAFVRFGAFVRTRAKTSMKYSKNVSEPGNPPRAHSGLIRDFLFFAVESHASNVVIGPMLLNATRSKTTLTALEHGGLSLIFQRATRNRPASSKPIMVEARPFMQPAFETELERAPYLWENSLRETA